MPIVSDYTAILTPFSWNGNDVANRPVILTYSFNTSPASYLAGSGFSADFVNSLQPFTAEQQESLRSALQAWAEVSGVVFIEVPSGFGDLQFGQYDFLSLPNSPAAFAFYPTATLTETGASEDPIGGDVFLNANIPFTFYLAAHEIGHALGFKHSFEGDITLDPALDNTDHTVMSYTGGTNPITGIGPFDIEAVEHLYGLASQDGGHVASWSWDAANLTLTQTGGASADIIRGIYVADIIEGEAGDDILFGAAGDDAIHGGLGEDSVFGGAGDDTLDGDAGDDFMTGGDGDDVMSGGAGADWIDGGAGVDIASYAQALGPVIVDLGLAGVPQDTLGAGLDTLLSIEGVEGSAFDDVLTGSFGDDILAGGLGEDLLHGGGGDDRLVLSAGSVDRIFGGDDPFDVAFDMLDASFLSGAVIVQLSGYATTAAHELLALVSGVEGAIGSSFDDALIGTDAANRFAGAAGSDWIVGQGGDDWFVQGVESGVDRLFGDAGFDTIDYSAAAGGVVVQLSGYATTSAGALLATFSGIEGANGSNFDDSLTGNAGGDVLFGGDGADWLVGRAGADSIVGGRGDDRFVQKLEGGGADLLFGQDGFDTLDYSAASAAVTVQLGSGYAASAGVLDATFSGIEAVIGSAFDDALIGDAADNRLTGGAGSDWLVGGAGDDWFVQGTQAGVDRLFGGSGATDAGIDTIDYALATAGVAVQLSGYATTRAGALLATFSGIENVVGSTFDDALIGSAAANRFTGGAGSDWLVGGGGDDWFVQGLEGGVDRLFGGAAGADAGVDTIDYSQAGAGVIVQLSGYATTSAGALLATFSGIENALGTRFDDSLIGNAADNRFVADVGADWLVGGGGDDAFVLTVDLRIDHVFGDSGFDTLDYSGANTSVVVNLFGYAAAGGGLTIAMLSGVEAVIGTRFNDSFVGNDADNVLTGGAGADSMYGQGGADRFVYQTALDGGDHILDFSRAEGDRIDLSAMDANPFEPGDQSFSFSAARTPGRAGEVVVTAVHAQATTVSLYLDGDDFADMTFEVQHQSGLILNQTDFVL